MYGKAISDPTLGYSLFTMSSETHIFIGVTTTTEDHMGLIKMKDLTSSRKIDWYNSLTCSTFCRMTSVIQSSARADYIYTASILKDSTNTYGQLHHFDSLGTYYWSQEFTMGSASISSYQIARTMTSISGGSKLVQIWDTSGSVTYITVFEVSTSSHSDTPTSTSVYTIGSNNGIHRQAWGHSSNSNQIFLLENDNDSYGKIIKLDLSTFTYKATAVPMSSGSSFQIYSVVKNAQGSSDGDFYYAGKTTQATDGGIN